MEKFETGNKIKSTSDTTPGRQYQTRGLLIFENREQEPFSKTCLLAEIQPHSKDLRSRVRGKANTETHKAKLDETVEQGGAFSLP